MRRLAAALLLSAALPAAAQEAVPSGQALVLWQVLWERPDGTDQPQAVLRYIAPAIAREGGTIDADAAQTDMDWLCERHGLPIAALAYTQTGSIVVTLMDRPVPRGHTDPDATQYFALYELVDGGCVASTY